MILPPGRSALVRWTPPPATRQKYPSEPMNLEQARTNMVEQQIRTWEVLDQDVLDLLYTVPREEFVPVSCRNLAFSDMEIPIGEAEKMWAPKMEARVLQELAPRRSD